MSKVKKKINTHLKAAQRWLGQAEKSFEDDWSAFDKQCGRYNQFYFV